MPATINASSSSGIVTTADNSAQLELQTGNTTRLTIDSSGNVGIGTTSPSSYGKLAINGALSQFGFSSANTTSDVTIARSSSATTIQNAPCITFSDSTTPNNTWTVQAGSGNLQFWNYQNTWFERMRIDSAGNILIAKAARGTVLTNNTLSFDMNASSNFSCTPSALGTLTFTNITSGQSGFILLVNTGGFAISASAAVDVSATTLTTISAAGTYLLSYFSNGTNIFVTNSGALA